MTDEEFGREMIAGVNPVCIALLTVTEIPGLLIFSSNTPFPQLCINLLQKFPPVSNLDQKIYGDQTSTMTANQLEKNMNGLTVTEVRALGRFRGCGSIA